MRDWQVQTPVTPTPPAHLGRLGPPLARLAGQQGAWPPVLPAHVARVAGSAGLPGADPLEAGAAEADRLADGGTDLVVVGGGGPRLPALVLLAALLGRDPVAAVGTTPTADWSVLVAGVRDGLRRARPHLWDPPALLDAVGAPDVASLAGLLLQCAVRRTPVLLSGAPDVWAAVLVAQRVHSAVPVWCTSGCSPRGELAGTAVAESRLVPLLDLGLDDPRGAELALALLAAGVDLARDGDVARDGDLATDGAAGA